MANGSDRVYVSLDTLRTEIRAANSELELSLRKYIADELDKKAPIDLVASLVTQVSVMEHAILTDEERKMVRAINRGELSRTQMAVIEDLVIKVIQGRTDKGWTKRERILTVVGIALWILTTVFSLLALILGGP